MSEIQTTQTTQTANEIQKDKIQYHFDSLKKYDESSYVLDNLENKLTFYEIAKKNIDLSNEC